MKKTITTLTVVCALLAFIPVLSAFAEENEPTSNNVTITVVMPDKLKEQKTESADIPPAEVKLYPVDVTENFEGNRRQIVKTYELSPLDNPADISRADFERNNWKYSLTDIVKHETANAEILDHKETVTLNTDTKDLEKIMTLLAPTLEYKTDDEFVGLLTLDVSSIKVKTAGTKTTSYEMKVTREYPNLSANDTSLVPKTVTENGKTYNLAGVDWKASNYTTVDYERVPEYYTAYATYTATGSSTKVTGYVTTAEYTGTLAKLSEGRTVYTAYFEGTEIRTPLEMTDLPASEPIPALTEEAVKETACKYDETSEFTEETAVEPAENLAETSVTEQTVIASKSENNSNTANAILYVIIALLALMLGGAAYLLKRKGKFQNEKISNNTPVAVNGGDNGSADVGK
ncbi:hypothetical protein FACS1894133_3710 [Clostridia bacterium]|nr:hypothetical protein FACS1894133_3710 [Clostridia bacterium]